MMMEEATVSTSGSSEGILVVVERPLVVEDLVVPLVRVQSGGGGGERDDASELVTRGDEASENRVAAEVSPWVCQLRFGPLRGIAGAVLRYRLRRVTAR
ncbi:hypothetical protein HPB47_026881 [Ixodes persulcatus]|uniref:Uncharacterized protein n=1 Tax=Ixodes persulcatus TaxID=34615 RepID=A0AC60PZ36_IXOPE|nr:hypothetical protein HPB47_026881 [Ixodes persulcatus]